MERKHCALHAIALFQRPRYTQTIRNNGKRMPCQKPTAIKNPTAPNKLLSLIYLFRLLRIEMCYLNHANREIRIITQGRTRSILSLWVCSTEVLCVCFSFLFSVVFPCRSCIINGRPKARWVYYFNRKIVFNKNHALTVTMIVIMEPKRFVRINVIQAANSIVAIDETYTTWLHTLSRQNYREVRINQ